MNSNESFDTNLNMNNITLPESNIESMTNINNELATNYNEIISKSKKNNLKKIVFEVFNHQYVQRIIMNKTMFFDDFTKIKLSQLFVIYTKLKCIDLLEETSLGLLSTENEIMQQLNQLLYEVFCEKDV